MSGSLAGKLALLGTGVMLLAGCSHPRSVGPTRTVQVVVTEYRLAPSDIRARPGPLTIVVHNLGRLTHNLVIFSGARATGSTKPIWPGQVAVLKVNLPPGTYSMTSTMLSDQALGAYGTLTIGT